MTFVDRRALVRRLDTTCVHALETAVARAASGHFHEIGVEHLLHALLTEQDDELQAVLEHVGCDRARFAAAVDRTLQRMRTGCSGRPVFSERMFEWLQNAWLAASVERGEQQVRSVDLLLEFLKRQERYVPDAYEAIEHLTVEALAHALTQVEKQRSEGETGRPLKPMPEAGREALERFTISLTDRASRGDIDPVFGRDREIRQVIDILARRRKNNPIIVGEPGVGKTALVEGLALAIVRGEVPQELHDVDLRALDLGALRAGAGVRGELEQRLKKVLVEVQSSLKPIIIFIDEAHMLVGAQTSDNDLSNLLKPALARGELRTIAATTYSEYKRYFDKDPALSRRFQPVQVDEPNVSDALAMLRPLRATYERAHGVVIRDEAFIAAVELSDRYISGRQLPDKAVDLIDTACARVKLEQAAPPQRLVALNAQLASLEHELAGREQDVREGAADHESLDELGARKRELEAERMTLQAQVEREREAVAALQAAQEALRSAGEPQLRDALGERKEALAAVQGETPLVHYEVDRSVIEQVLSEWTGIPVGKMKTSTVETLLDLEEHLHRRIKGQNHVVRAVADAMRVSHAGLREPTTPIAVLLFVGPSGVGKTETAAALADLLYGGERSMISINMSEFQEKHNVSRLIGSPPGYVGYGEGGVLTEAVRQKPYSVVLLDECEKADPGVMNLFYQVFDKGVLSDGEGRETSFKNTVVILTSNLASETIARLHEDPDDIPTTEALVEAIRPELSRHFKPALLARMSIVPFRPMDDATLQDVARSKLARLADRLRRTHALETVFDQTLIEDLARRCMGSESGARALDHLLRGDLMPMLSRALLQNMAREAPCERLLVTQADGGWKLHFDAPAPTEAVAEPPAELVLN